MKTKTSELTRHALDWAVAKCLEPEDNKLTIIRHEDHIGHPIERETESGSYDYEWWCPSRIQAQGAPLLNLYKISRTIDHSGLWIAYAGYNLNDEKKHMQCDKEELVAGLRCVVALKLGDEIDIPEELT